MSNLVFRIFPGARHFANYSTCNGKSLVIPDLIVVVRDYGVVILKSRRNIIDIAGEFLVKLK